MNRKLLTFIFAAFFCFFVNLSSVLADDNAPVWLQEAARLPTPVYEIKGVPTVVLRNEEIVTVEADGTLTRTTRYAVRILVREGREEARARAIYRTDSEKVRDLKAWLIHTGGPTKSYGKKEVIDVALAANDLYNEARVKVIDASDQADTGDVFGYETVSESRTIFSQFQFEFQDRLPVLAARFNVNLPDSWTANSVTFNHANVEPAANNNSYVWELRDLQPINYEPSSPKVSSLAPRLAVSFYPAQAAAAQIRTFSNWNDVAKWMSEIEDPQMNTDDALAGKARELTANAKTEFEKIQAIARYIQQIQYISIQIGTGKGGGYRPHLATEIFAKSYGDCKDKANLMRAMLNAVGITAYMVSITADDAGYVRAEWASPHQFNHCIIAIKISDATDAPSVITHPQLGRFLIFDATDPYTRLGDLPEEEQGSLALIDHKDTEAVSKMPVLPPEMNQVERTIDATLSPEGAISGTISEKSSGQSASLERSRLRGFSAAEYKKMIENWISRGVSGAQTTRITPQDNAPEGGFSLHVEFGANSYAQLMQGHLLVFKPAIIGRLERLSFSEGRRMQPFLIDANTYSESVKIKIPAGFAVDEMPEAAKLETAFGKYSATYEVKDDYLIFNRSLKLNRATIPAEKYDTVRNFFGQIHAAEQSPVVLVKK
ncbi:MAG: DUF3857 domain-containing protein [Pyrinomonadaceae bacterium]